jgi:putative PIN family toxin of toxin-antitoxin system
MSEHRIVIDTGVAVSAVLLPGSVPRRAFDTALARGVVLVSEATVAELDDVLRRAKFNKYVAEDRRLEFLAALVRETEAVEITESVTACRDAKDNKFLELAVCGRASCLLTGDQDLLALHPFRGVPILTPAQFLESLPPEP